MGKMMKQREIILMAGFRQYNENSHSIAIAFRNSVCFKYRTKVFREHLSNRETLLNLPSIDFAVILRYVNARLRSGSITTKSHCGIGAPPSVEFDSIEN